MLIRGKDKCCVCRVSKKEFPFLHLFRFPRTKERCLQWIESAGVIDELRQYEPDRLHHLFRMCMRHFEPKHFKNSDMISLNRHNAIPTLFGEKALPIDFFPKQVIRGKLPIPKDKTCQNRTTISNTSTQFVERKDNTENEILTVNFIHSNYTGVLSVSAEEYYHSETTSKTNSCDGNDVILYSEIINDSKVNLLANDKRVTKNVEITENTAASNNVEVTYNNDFIPNTTVTNALEIVNTPNNKHILFRKICSTPLKLPSTMWTTVVDPNGEYFLVFLVSYFNGFLVNRGIRFTPDMTNPDIHIGNTKVLFSAFDPIYNVEDVERLINDVDKLLLCPGTGLAGIGYSNTCTGLAQISESMNVIPCAECEILDNLVNMQHSYQK